MEFFELLNPLKQIWAVLKLSTKIKSRLILRMLCKFERYCESRGLNILKPAGIPTLLYSDFKVLASLPQAQVNLNPLIKQNPGY